MQPWLLAVAAAVFVGVIASLALGTWRRSQLESRAGLVALCAMKWRDYSHVVQDLLRERGFGRNDDERGPQNDGYDLMMTRGNSRYLIECKNGAAHRVTEDAIRELSGLVELQGAGGAVIATTGRVDAQARTMAASRRVEIIAGDDLWRQARPWVPHELRGEVEGRARRDMLRRIAIAAALALAAGLVMTLLSGGSADDAIVVPAAEPVVRTPRPASPTAVAPAPVAVPKLPVAMPDPSLDNEQLASRRASVELEVRSNPMIGNAVWSTKSTLVVTLRQAGVAIPDAILDEGCRILVQFEELRYTRLQVESLALDSDAAPSVRWRQCR